MTRCTEKTLQGKRCKKHASHNGRCLLHISDRSTETTVEVDLPLITDSNIYADEMYDAFALILSRFSENEIKYISSKAIENKSLLK